MGGIKNTVQSVVKHPARAIAGGFTGGLSEAFQQNPYGVPLPFTNPLNTGLNAVLGHSDSSSAIPGPFSLDPEQYRRDKGEILDLGNKQYSDTLAGIDTYDSAQNKRAKELFSSMLPGIAENSNAAHLYDSSGYGQEVARQQSEIASKIAADSADKRLAALTGRQGFETGALQRGQSLEDFINQANVAKTIGAQMAPQPASGKQNFGTVAQGVGALSPWGKLFSKSGDAANDKKQ